MSDAKKSTATTDAHHIRMNFGARQALFWRAFLFAAAWSWQQACLLTWSDSRGGPVCLQRAGRKFRRGPRIPQ